jgi:hypothetical protein
MTDLTKEERFFYSLNVQVNRRPLGLTEAIGTSKRPVEPQVMPALMNEGWAVSETLELN